MPVRTRNLALEFLDQEVSLSYSTQKSYLPDPSPTVRTLGRTAMGLRDRRVVKLFLVGEGDE